jgi:hypothetical protein
MSDPDQKFGEDSLPAGSDVPSPEEATELSREEEIEINRQLSLGLEEFEGGIEG